MLLVGIFQLILWELLIPFFIGIYFLDMDMAARKIPFAWVCGQIVLWAGFQLLSVPLILKEISFKYVVVSYAAVVGSMLTITVITYFRGMRGMHGKIVTAKGEKCGKNTESKIFAAIFTALLILQMVMAVVMTYSDGDDAYYVAVSTITENSETMYIKLPYTGGTTDLDVRHSLAPFPIWIAFLSEVSGIKAVSVAHIAVPLALIPMTYAIFYLISTLLLKGKDIPLFLVLSEILVLFGDYSYYTAENFLIARSRQGKAALGNIVIPMLIWLLLTLMEQLKDKKKINIKIWILFAATMITGCLCSTLGAVICCVLVGITALCMAICYKKWKFMLNMGVCCLPCVIYAAIYVFIK